MDDHNKIAKLLRMQSTEIAMCRLIIPRNMAPNSNNYKEGMNDKIIADITGVSEINIKTIRWYYFGDNDNEKRANVYPKSILNYCEMLREKLLEHSDYYCSAAEELSAIMAEIVYHIEFERNSINNNREDAADPPMEMSNIRNKVSTIIDSLYAYRKDLRKILKEF
jgi:hypothetical protein